MKFLKNISKKVKGAIINLSVAMFNIENNFIKNTNIENKSSESPIIIKKQSRSDVLNKMDKGEKHQEYIEYFYKILEASDEIFNRKYDIVSNENDFTYKINYIEGDEYTNEDFNLNYDGVSLSPLHKTALKYISIKNVDKFWEINFFIDRYLNLSDNYDTHDMGMMSSYTLVDDFKKINKISLNRYQNEYNFNKLEFKKVDENNSHIIIQFINYTK